jgi:hypothetical protein
LSWVHDLWVVVFVYFINHLNLVKKISFKYILESLKKVLKNRVLNIFVDGKAIPLTVTDNIFSCSLVECNWQPALFKLQGTNDD